MDTVKFLEELANKTHFDFVNERLLASQSVELKNILLNNNSEQLKSKISNGLYLADMTHVFQV
jgi:hypothetical protein